MVSRRVGIWLFLALAVVVAVAALLTPRTDLPPSYHQFADQRTWLGIPHFGDVSSNLAFVLAGVCGLVFLSKESNRTQFIDPAERWPYFFVFVGLVLTAFGSAYYHLAPDNTRLVWDRIPMTIVFMPLVAAQIGERVNVNVGLWLLPILTAIGIGSVLQWRWTVVHGAPDVRFYAAVQLYSVAVLFIVLLLPPRYTHGSDLLAVAGLYVLAKICESADHQIFSIGHFVSGHSLKHLAAGLAGFWILRMLQRRRPIEAY